MNPQTVQKLNIPFFFLTSFSCYLGARTGFPWLGMLVFALLVAFFLPHTPQKKERLVVALVAGAGGFLTDTALIAFNVYTVRADTRWLLPAPLCPEWTMVLWLNFGFMLYIFWRFLGKSLLTAVSVGVIFSLLIVGNASRMGLIALHQPVIGGYLINALCWAILIPLFTRCASRFFGGEYAASQK